MNHLSKQLQSYLPKPWEKLLRELSESALEDCTDALYPALARRLAQDGFARGATYLHFGDPPRGGRSFMAREISDSLRERGLSVFPARRTTRGHYVLDPANWALRQTLTWLRGEEDRPAYVVDGKVRRGRGACGEPLLWKIAGFSPLPPGALVAIEPASAALEMWNVRRQGGWLEDIPELVEFVSVSEAASGYPEPTFWDVLTEVTAVFGRQEPLRAEAKTGRNEPCPCGSGKKHKKCCEAGI